MSIDRFPVGKGYRERMTSADYAKFFDKIPVEEVNQFGYQERDGNLVGIKDFFEAYFYGVPGRYFKCTEGQGRGEERIAKIQFLRLYRENAWEVLKIGKEMELLKKLMNIEENWRDATEYTHSNSGNSANNTSITENNTQEEIRETIQGILTGEVDAAQLSQVVVESIIEESKEKILGYLDPNARSRSHVITKDGGKNTFKFNNNHTNIQVGNHKSDSSSKTYFSNTSKDIIELINLNMPALLKRFLNNFAPLFLW